MPIPMVAATAASVSKASKAAKAPASHPPFAKMIVEAIAALKEKGGSSRQAILKYIKSHYKVDERIAEVNVRRVLVSATASGKLIRVKGAGASGSFKVAYKAEKAPAVSSVEKSKRAVPAKPKNVSAAVKKPVAVISAQAPKANPKPKKVTAANLKKAQVKKVTKRAAAATKKGRVVKTKKPAAKKMPKKSAIGAKK